LHAPNDDEMRRFCSDGLDVSLALTPAPIFRSGRPERAERAGFLRTLWVTFACFLLDGVGAIPMLLVSSGILQLLARALGSSAPFDVTRGVVAYASAPLLIQGLPWLGWVALPRGLVVSAVRLARAHRISRALIVSLATAGAVLPSEAAVVLALLWSFYVEAFKIPPGSMLPTLLVNDHVFVPKSAYGLFDKELPARGDVIVRGTHHQWSSYLEVQRRREGSLTRRRA
jgi:hypothetical protein